MRVSTIAVRPWQVRSSPLARATFAVYALLLLYSGLAPWSGWRDLGLAPFAYLTAPIPRYVTMFDLAVNVLAYMPLGALAVFALHPRTRHVAAVLAAMAVGATLSGAIETMQGFLPTRVASNLDLATNTAGALLGAALVAPFTSSLIDRGRLADWRMRWFERRVSTLLLLLALWPIAQIYPERMLFANGDVRHWLTETAAAFGGRWWEFDGAWFGPAEFVLAEAFVVAAAVLAAGLSLALAMRDNAPRGKLLAALLLAAVAAKSMANAVQFGPERTLAWLTPGAYGGLALGAFALLAASTGRSRWLRGCALLAAVLLIAAVNLVPDNPYHQHALQGWRQGALTHFNALAHWLSILWPYLLVLWLASAASGRPNERPSW